MPKAKTRLPRPNSKMPDTNCVAALWQHAHWWYVVEQHDCERGKGWLLVSHHHTRSEAAESGLAQYPRPHGAA
jgi:hypothetical protein